MRYQSLGNTGTQVSVLCLGAMTFGEAAEGSMMHGIGADERESFAVLDRAVEAGINFIDTADVYGQDGLSERVLGKWLRERGARDNVVVATKGRFRMAPGPNGTGASRLRITRAIDASLRRLGTDRLDLYQIHMQDAKTPEEEVVRALDDAVRAGKILYFGASNYAAYRLMEALWIADKRNLDRFVTLQAQYSLAVRALEREHVPLCAKFKLGVLPWSPLAGGLLTGKYRRHQEAPAGSRMEAWKSRYQAFDTEKNWTIVETLGAVATELGHAPGQVALAWLLSRPVVSSVIFGARNVKQLDENLGAVDLVLPAEAIARLDAASAPELGDPYDFIRQVDGVW
jgi:aryl-alcohol dehydrogenase-like predicted oxidoreductase